MMRNGLNRLVENLQQLGAIRSILGNSADFENRITIVTMSRQNLMYLQCDIAGCAIIAFRYYTRVPYMAMCFVGRDYNMKRLLKRYIQSESVYDTLLGHIRSFSCFYTSEKIQ